MIRKLMHSGELVEGQHYFTLSRRNSKARVRSNSGPLTVHEVKQFLDAVPDWYRDLYDVWFRLGLASVRDSRHPFRLARLPSFALLRFASKKLWRACPYHRRFLANACPIPT